MYIIGAPYVLAEWRDPWISYGLCYGEASLPCCLLYHPESEEECGPKEVKSKIGDRNWGMQNWPSMEELFPASGIVEKLALSQRSLYFPRAAVLDV